jgi:hypothetical protein
MTCSQPTWLENAIMNAIAKMVDSTTGTHQLGRRAMSANVAPGDVNTPTRREISLRGGADCTGASCGGGVMGAGSGVMGDSVST